MPLRFACLLVLFACQVQGAEFIPLGDLPGGGFSSEALDVDAMGATVVGSSAASAQSDAFKWSLRGKSRGKRVRTIYWNKSF
jgi:hypothetical protein